MNFSKKMALTALLSTSAVNSSVMNPVDMGRQMVNIGTTTAMVAQDVSVLAMMLGQIGLCAANITLSYCVLKQTAAECICKSLLNTAILGSAALLGKGFYKAKKPVVETKTVYKTPEKLVNFLQNLKDKVLSKKDTNITVTNNIVSTENLEFELTEQEQQNILNTIDHLHNSNQSLSDKNTQLNAEKTNLGQQKEQANQQIQDLTKENENLQKINYMGCLMTLAQSLNIPKNQKTNFVNTFGLNQLNAEGRDKDSARNRVAKLLTSQNLQTFQEALLLGMDWNSFDMTNQGYRSAVNNLKEENFNAFRRCLVGPSE